MLQMRSTGDVSAIAQIPTGCWRD